MGDTGGVLGFDTYVSCLQKGVPTVTQSWRRWLLVFRAAVARILGLASWWTGSKRVGGHKGQLCSTSSRAAHPGGVSARLCRDAITNNTPSSAAAKEPLTHRAEDVPWPRQSSRAAFMLTAHSVSDLITDDAGTRTHTVTVANPTAFPVIGNAALGVEKDVESGTPPTVTAPADGSGSYSEMTKLLLAGTYRFVRAQCAGVGCSPYRLQN
jgi:hypothetical protein